MRWQLEMKWECFRDSAPDGTRVTAQLNLLLEEEDTPVIWRGLLISGVVLQFGQM